MIIGVDGNEANVKNKVGVSVYTYELLAYFQSHANANTQFIVYLREVPRDEMPKQTEYFTYKVVWGPTLWSQFFLPIHLWFSKLSNHFLDVFFSPAHYIPRYCPFKTVVTIHDLSYLYFPNEFLKKDLYQLKNWTEYALKNSAKIIAVSKTTKKDVMHEYGIPDNKIDVVYNGYKHISHQSATGKLSTDNTPYFLYVGTIQPRKNISLLISSFAQFYKVHPEFKLILAGKKGWLYEDIFSHSKELRVQDSVIFPGFVSEEEKDSLYKKASAYILPSLYEGFGIPLLEAMSHRCPVLSSFSSSLPEVGGEACLYFDPKSSTDLVEKMELIISDKALAKKLVTAGTERCSLFSWDESGRKTLEILSSMRE